MTALDLKQAHEQLVALLRARAEQLRAGKRLAAKKRARWIMLIGVTMALPSMLTGAEWGPRPDWDQQFHLAGLVLYVLAGAWLFF
ncbi:MAG TPA: hypothetical protein VFX59_22010, partial [Polyangiales bacterium]|nr:hypothetical protein [Polyangiales bacterium]